MKIYLLGAANPETIRMIRAIQRSRPNVHFPGLLDNDPDKKHTDFYGIPVLGGLELVKELMGPDVRFVNLITGNTQTRHTTTQQILAVGGKLENFIHPSIDLTMTTLGKGLYVQEAVILQAGAVLGNNTSVHMGALIGHESIIGESAFIAHAVSISGCCIIGDGVFIGTNATVLPRVKIGKWATVGAGAVIISDVPDGAVVVGNPGKILKINDIPVPASLNYVE